MTSDTSARRHAERRRTGLPAAAGALVVAGSVAVISLDRRQHVVGHDNVVGPSSATVPGMHWDPADGWDQEHFMALVGAPAEGRHGVGPTVPW
ncbi:hypothetical protein ABZ461_22795 [Actinacidiphila glaucinigra]|uniref:hypothetical protein n=1 Tax=Actinacidiphila glaucinigra TaxID=235986 RepID=UPI0033D4B90C